MKWILACIIFAIGSSAVFDHSDNSGCRESLGSLRRLCGSSSPICDAASPSDCVDHIRKARELASSISETDFYCVELKYFASNHSCERTLKAAEQRHGVGRRIVRSPSAESIQRWRNQLRTALHREVHTISQSNESCYHALYDNCLRHVSCRELWKIFRQLCVVDAQNQCRMTSKEDCWQSFEGISWTGLGTCTCFDDNSDCHWIRLQTNYNKCIYEILQDYGGIGPASATSRTQTANAYSRPDNMYGSANGHNDDLSRSREIYSTKQPSLVQSSGLPTPDVRASSTARMPGFSRSSELAPTTTPYHGAPSTPSDRRRVLEVQGRPPAQGAKEYNRNVSNNGRTSSPDRFTFQTSPSLSSSSIEITQRTHDQRRPSNEDQTRTDSSQRRTFVTSTTTSPVVFHRPNSKDKTSTNRTLSSQLRKTPSTSRRPSYTIQATFLTPKTTSATRISAREQRRREHELFLKQQHERQLAEQRRQETIKRQKEELERAAARMSSAANSRSTPNSIHPSPFPQSVELLETSPFPPTSNSFSNGWRTTTPPLSSRSTSTTTTSTTTTTTTTTAVPSSESPTTPESEPMTTTQTPKPKTDRKGFPSPGKGKGRKKIVNASAFKYKNATMRPPSWRPNQKLNLQPTVSELPIVTTEIVSTNLERPPTSPVMNRSTVARKPAIRRHEEEDNEDDDSDDYGGGLHFYSDVIFSKKKFKQDAGYNESTCNRAHKRCAQDETCKWHLSEVQMKCTLTDRCNRDRCAEAIQRFTQYVPKPLVEAMMFCHCMVSDIECVEQQQWMYPRCLYAEQQEIGPITCTEAVEKCRSEANCEHYSSLFFQLCNTEGGQCTNADLDRCRHALIEVRATFLEFPCYCVQSDLDCRRIQNGMLPNNPCVEKSMMEYSQQLEAKFLEPFTPNPATTINSNAIDPSAPTSTATSNRSSARPSDEEPGKRLELDDKLPALSTQVPPRRTSTATTSGQKVKLEIEPENEKFNQSRYELSSTKNATTQKATTRVPLISYTSEELKDREPMPEGGCYTKNAVGGWIRHYKDTIIRKNLEWSGRCTSWCECDKNGNLSCRSINCQSNTTCQMDETSVFFGQKLYLKDRGACTCSEDDFVCQLPRNLDPLETGLYVFAGYSPKELELLRKHVPANILERSGFVSAHREVARDISSQLQQALERVMPLTEKCRLVLLEQYLEDNIIMHQVQWYGVNHLGNDTKPKWHTGMLEKICSPYVKKLATIFEVSDAGRHQLVLSVVKQLKVVDMLDSIPSTGSTIVLHFFVTLVVLFAQHLL